MAVLAVAAAGAAIGGAAFGTATFLGVSAAGWGWAIGSVVGNMLFSPKTNTEGPRLTSIRFSQSSYGVTLPIVIGAYRVGANVIWMGQLEEIANKQKIGKRAYNTTYTYRQSFAAALCEGPVSGVRKIWFDGELVYSNLASDSITALAAGKIEELMSVYTGTEDQEADPVMEAEDGAGNVPAYRGVCYIAFERLDLTQWGNRIPSIVAEVVENATFTAPTVVSEYPDGHGTVIANGDSFSVATWSAATPTCTITTYDVDNNVIASTVYNGNIALDLLSANSSVTPCAGAPGIGFMNVLGPESIPSCGTWLYSGLIYDEEGISRRAVTHDLFDDGVRDTASSSMLKQGAFIYASGENPQSTVGKFAIHQDGTIGHEPVAEWDTTSYASTTGGGGVFLSCDGSYVYARNSAWASPYGSDIARLTLDLEFVDAIQGPTFVGDQFVIHDGRLLLNTYLLDTVYKLSEYTINDDNSVTKIGEVEINAGGVVPVTSVQMMDVGGGLVYTQHAQITMIPVLNNAGRTLDEVVTSICGRAGLESGEIDVSELSSITVLGTILDARSSARSWLEPLLAAYSVDAVESNGKIKFVVRGGSAVDTIFNLDLGAGRDGLSTDEQRFSSAREKQSSLPNRVDVTYASAENYEAGTQTAVRGQTLSQQSASLSFPVAMTDDAAARLAAKVLYESWASRMRREFSTSVAYGHLEPADPVLVQEADGTLTRMRITSKSEDDGIIQWSAVEDDDGTQTQVVEGVALPTPDSVRLSPTSNRSAMFEVPALRDDEATQVGVYVAAAGLYGTWPGGALYVNTPGESNFVLAGALTEPGIVGAVESLMDDFDAGDTNFYSGTMDVNVSGGSLSTISESAWLAGGNLALVGGELITFKTATSLGDGSYRLSNILRGRYGTDYAGAHLDGEDFALLDPLSDAMFIPLGSSQLGVEREFRIVNAGGNVVETAPLTYSLIGRTIKPIPPVLVNMIRQANGDRTIRWTRRARAYQDWREDADIPLIESSESYRIELIDADTGDSLRSGTVTTNSYTYTAANIETDFGVHPDSLRIKIWQQSAILGDGQVADVTLSWARDFAALYEKDWDDSVTSDTTAFGAGTPAMAVETLGAPFTTSNQLKVTTSGGYTQDVKVRVDDVPYFKNGLLKVLVRMPTTSVASEVGLVARTTYWRNALNGYGYGVYVNHSGNVVLGKGSNSDASTWTTISSTAAGVAVNELVELAWVIQGTSHKVYVNGTKKIDTTDSSISSSGGCGVRVGNPSEPVTRYFDNFSVQFNRV